MSKEELEKNKVVEPVVEPTVDPEPTTDKATDEVEDEEPEVTPVVEEPVAEPATEPETESEPTIADVLQAVNKLVDAFTQSVAKPAVAEPEQPTQTVEVKIAEKPAVAEQTMVFKPNFNPLGFDTTHYDI